MEVTAQLNNLRIAPRKVRLLCGILKGMDVHTAVFQLDYIAKRSARPLTKLLESAMANASNNFGLVKDNLFVKQVIVNEGPKLKRFRPKGFGSASPIEKKTSHIKVILEERVIGLRADSKAAPEAKKEKEVSELSPKKPTKRLTSAANDSSTKKGRGADGAAKSKTFFRRKAI